MPTLTFDGVSLLTTNIRTRYVKHESAPDREITRLAIARRDGSIFVTQRYGEKVIRLAGTIKGSSQADLETRVDSFKELLSREQKKLVISWNGTTREYVASCLRHDLDSDHYHIDWRPWEVEFLVSSGEGADPSTTNALTGEALTLDTPDTVVFVLQGSKPPRPIIEITGNNWPTGCLGIEVKNVDTGEKVQITNNVSWGTNSKITIDCDAKTIEHDVGGVVMPLDFIGTIPTFRIGTNTIQVAAGRLLVVGTTEPSISDVGATSAMGTNTRYAQSFSIPYTNNTFRTIRVPLQKFGTPTGDLTARIETDNGGKPSGTVVATFTLAASSIGASMAYFDIDIAAFQLDANKTYWLVLYGASFDNSNGAYWGHVATQYGLPGSVTRVSSDGGSTWNTPISREQAFQLFYGGLDGTSGGLLDVTYTKKWL